ncbi:MAG: SpoIID/LytB domain-containing protein [Actinobacteria bacterium]|nr:SpoIID/LytB domain-containing protein [Actinomycetota bacterium]
MQRKIGGIVLAGLLFAAVAAGQSRAASELVLTGRGWGHGIGLSQWGAYGYALHGWDYKRILAHYYPGTKLGTTGEPRVRVLVGEDVTVATVGCASGMRVSDATGVWWPLRAGTYGVSSSLVLPLTHARRHHRTVWLGRALRSPAVLECALNPLTFDGRGYHGKLVLRADGGKLQVIDALPLDTYVRGVVAAEMPHRWSLAALQAQAVAARSYAVATLHPSAPFDEYADQRSQMFLGLAAETPRSDQAVMSTLGQVLTYGGSVALAYYSASSGGRTADVRDLWPSMGPVPYLRPVPDPYDGLSPHHLWGPIVLTPERLASELGVGGSVAAVRLEKSFSGRVGAVDLSLASGGSVRLPARQVAARLGLRSTWFSVGELSLDVSRGRVLFGGGVHLVARSSGVGRAVLQKRVGAGPWLPVRTVGGGATVTVEPRVTTQYRLSVPGVAGPELAVAVAPAVTVKPLGPSLLGGRILPRPTAPVTVLRYEPGGWRVVAHPLVGPDGAFRTPVRLRAGGYRVVVGGDSRLAAAQASLTVTKRLLASLH